MGPGACLTQPVTAEYFSMTLQKINRQESGHAPSRPQRLLKSM
jgi:hypothetical protein